MAPNRSKFQTLDAFATIDKTLFTQKNTPLLSDEERNTATNQDILSFKHIEENLRVSAEKREEHAEDIVEEDTLSEDEYWGWCNDEPPSARRKRENKRLLEKILKEEETRIFFSAAETERRLVEAAAKQAEQKYIEVPTTQEAPDYWLWRSDQDVTREFFSADKLENNLKAECEARSQMKDSDYIFSPSNQEDFWGWNNDETPAERRQKEKKAILDNILLEEKMHKEFLIQAIEKRLLEEAKISEENVIINESADTNNPQEGNYWEW